MAKRTVAIGLVGSRLDQGRSEDRWERWRPSVALCQQPDLVIERYELAYQRSFAALAEQVARDVRQVSPETEVVLREFPLEDAWDFAEVFAALFDFARAEPFDADREDYLVHITTGTHTWQICLFLLTESRHIPGRLVQTFPSGQDPAGGYGLIDLDLSRYDRLAQRFSAERREASAFLKAGIETRDERFNRLMQRIEMVALSSSGPILLTGATGVGKTRLARRIYDLRRQKNRIAGEFVEINCATIRGDQAMSALFGHVAGAFTGAVVERSGCLRAADGGMLFLDEIGELGLDEQTMLLCALEQKSFLPLGSDHPVESDFQLIAGTNRDLGSAVREGRFRDDLLARIDLWSFALPPLVERRADIEPNLEWELERATREIGRRTTFNREARERFLAFASAPETPWLGNFRDFAAAITRMATLSPSGRIALDAVEEEIARLGAQWSRASEPAATGDGAVLERYLGPAALAELDRFERVQLADVLRVCSAAPSLSAAGRALFAASRRRKRSANDADRLAKYLARFGLRWADLAGASAP